MHRNAVASLVVTLALAALAGAPTAIASQAGRSFGAGEQVTAVDLVVELDPPHRLKPWIVPPAPADVVATVEGLEPSPQPPARHPVVAVDSPPRDPETVPWSVVLYFDLVLGDRVEVSWAAETLSRNLEELTRRGEVEVVVADPEPRTVVSPTRDGGAIQKVLERMIYFPETEDALVEARLERAATAGEDDREAEGGVTPLERGLIQDRLDAFLLTLADRSAGAEPRRLALLVSGGYGIEGSRALDEATQETARALAAYGWSVAPLLVPPPEGPERGLRIGKWRFHRPKEAWLGLPVLFAASRESERDPELAKAYLDLAESRRAQGELEGAASAARRSLTHFSDDPRTAELQAKALLVLAEVYEKQGRDQLARRTYLRAATRDPEGLADNPKVVAAISRPEAALARLAETTLGRLVRSDGDWAPLFHTLDRRGVVTIQLSGLPDGRLHAAQALRAGTSEPIPSTGLVRFGTPLAVAAARARRLLDDIPAQGDLPVTAAFLPAEGESGTGDGPRGLLLALRADLSERGGQAGMAHMRVTLAVPGAEGETRVIHFGPELVDPVPTRPWGWELRRPVTLPGRTGSPSGAGPDGVWGTVVVEELLTGAWGAALAQSVEGS